MLRALLAITLLVVFSGSAQAAEADPGREIAGNCANCHGTDGKSAGGMPRLAGLAKDYLVQQMQDFKSGKRPATIMHQLAKGYTDAEILSVASYLSQQK